MKKLLSLVAFCVVALAGSQAAQAQTSPSPSPAPAVSPAPSPLPSPSATPSAPPHLVQFSGFADAAYTTHVGPTTTEFSNGFPSRVFDYNDRTVNLQNLNVQAALNAGNLTGKLEVSNGTDANIIQSYPGAFSGTDVTQAYLAYQFGKLSIQGGKFETLAGAEVIEAPSDLNFSRSILFGFAVPFTHTGGRLTYAVTPHLNVIAGANAGWDELRSTNGRVTAEYGFAFNPSSAVSLTAQGYTGFEQLSNYYNPYNPYAPGVTGNQTPAVTIPVTPDTGIPPSAQGQRSLIDVVGTVHPTTATTVTVNYDHGLQHNAPSLLLDGTTLNASWSGLAGYASYNFTPKVTGSVRYEGFQDPQGYRTGFDGLFWHEGTATLAYNLTSALTLRGEYRHDVANEPVFLNSSTGTLGNGASTFALEGLVKF